MTNHVFRTYPSLPEGDLARVRAAVVNERSLAEAAERLGLGPHLLLGKGEDGSGGREKPSILADALEAVIGAVFLHAGPEAASDLVMDLLGESIAEAAADPGHRDYKTRLQELAARQGDALPRYEVIASGPDHAKKFRAAVHLGDTALGTGDGRSKKQAEQSAARAAWLTLAEPSPTSGEPDA